MPYNTTILIAGLKRTTQLTPFAPGSRRRVTVQFALLLALSVSIAAVSAGAPAPNLVGNGDFRHGSERWILQADAPASAKEQVFEALSAPENVRSRVLHIDIPTVAEHNWNIQVYQPGLDLANDQAYTVTFWARADRERTIDLNVALDEPDWHTVGLAVTRMPLSRDWHRYRYVFTAARTVKGHNRLTFVLGEAPGSVDLAQVSLVNDMPGLPAGPNLLESADFVDNTGDWSLQQSGKADARLQWQDKTAGPPDVSGRIAQIDVAAPGDNAWNVQFQQSGLDLLDREPYTLTLWARADHDRPLGVIMGVDMPDWHQVGLDYQTVVTPAWRKISVVFTAAHTVKDHSRLSFLVGNAPGTVELAGVQLRRNISATTAAPVLSGTSETPRALVGVWDNHSTDLLKRVRLTFNADGTGSVVTGMARPDAVPTAPVNAFHWYLKENGKLLTVGLRDFNWSIRTAGKDQILKLTDRKGIAHLFYRQ